jgi:hypothetical protein
MRMARHRLKLIALAAVLAVAPALAGHAATGKPTRHCCPKKHATAAAAVQGQAPARGGTITLSDRLSSGSVLDFGLRHGIFTP